LRLLLDTHAALWWLSNDDRFSARATEHVDDASNQLLLSAVVVWEVAIKRSIGKLVTPDGFGPALLSAGVLPLAVGFDHAAAVEHLPHHHRDPFDRLLVAQAQIEGATLVSSDEQLRAYDVPVLW